MKYKAILFDLDGTLLPMDQHKFTTGYFKLLYKRIEKYGLSPETFTDFMWSGVAAMVKNDGTITNEEAFWNRAREITGIEDLTDMKRDCQEFYGGEFREADFLVGQNPLAREAVKIACSKVGKVVLASNPLFPMVGHETRLSWVDLKRSDFDHVTSYENYTYCKPNPMYFEMVCKNIGVDPGECLHIGNDEEEDGYASSHVGIDCYIVTDCLEKSEKHPWEGDRGTFTEMLEMLRRL